MVDALGNPTGFFLTTGRHEARHLIEPCFCTHTHFRAIATRYDKTARNFLAAIHLAASAIWLN